MKNPYRSMLEEWIGHVISRLHFFMSTPIFCLHTTIRVLLKTLNFVGKRLSDNRVSKMTIGRISFLFSFFENWILGSYPFKIRNKNTEFNRDIRMNFLSSTKIDDVEDDLEETKDWASDIDVSNVVGEKIKSMSNSDVDINTMIFCKDKSPKNNTNRIVLRKRTNQERRGLKNGKIVVDPPDPVAVAEIKKIMEVLTKNKNFQNN
ncbi:MAG: hypothetical protein QXW79_01385 [Thermoplasmata archaeon]